MHHRYSALQRALLCLLLYTPLAGEAQTSFKKKIEAAPVRTYTVGDKVPDLVFKNLVNYPFNQSRLSDFKGKMIIIDFWELTCSSCIAAFPKMQKIQEQYKDQLQIITVTRTANLEEYTDFSSAFPGLKGFSLPTVLQDDNLYKYFPYEFISHLVWIDRNGIVKAITGTEYITPENIQLALRDEHLPWPVKKDVFGFEYDKPLLSVMNGEAKAPSMLYYSALTGYMEGIDATDKVIEDSVNQTVTYNHYNHNLLSLCDGSLWGQGTGNIPPKFLVLHVKDKTRYLRNNKTQFFNEWAKKNTYCYSVSMPMQLPVNERKEFIKKDLTRWLDVLGISVKKELSEVNGLALVKLKDKKPLITEGGEPESRYRYPYDSSILKNEPIGDFLNNLNLYNEEIPFLISNQTGYGDSSRLNMQFSRHAFASEANLRQELRQNGFDLLPFTWKTDMYVISEKDYSTQP
jgi:thiol-disulfide isomerase/thioredoxin